MKNGSRDITRDKIEVIFMKEPIQLWLPLLNFSVFNDTMMRDLQRAKLKWNGQDRIWLLPEIEETKSWQIGTFLELAVPSESFNIISILNVDEEDNIYFNADGMLPKEWKKIPDDLLEQWLKAPLPDCITWIDSFKIRMPFISEKTVEYEIREHYLKPASSFPMKIDGDEFEINLTPKSKKNYISLEYEGKDRFQGQQGKIGDMSCTIDQEGNVSLNTSLRWIEPFQSMFFLGGNADLIQHKYKMQNAIENNDTKTTKDWLGRFVDEGKNDLFTIWLLPKIYGRDDNENSEKLLLEIESKFNICCDNLDELLINPAYKKLFSQVYPIKRIFSWPGYLWWKLSTSMDQSKLKFCQRCRKLLTGKKNKKFCSKQDNPDCYRERRTYDKEQERKRKTALEKD
jgi:hypothetical protein